MEAGRDHMDAGRDHFSNQFRTWLAEFNPDADPAGLSPEENLFDAGVLDSFSVVSVVMFVEKFRGSELNLEEASIESFSSLDRIYETFIAVPAEGHI